jgi:hypothetical protein
VRENSDGIMELEYHPLVHECGHCKAGYFGVRVPKHEVLSSNPSATKKKKERVHGWNFLKHHDSLLGLHQCHHGTQPRVKEAPGCVICTKERVTPGKSGCLCPPPSLHLKTVRVHLRDQPVTQATNTYG